tara:strand:+ start:80 stop:532 length:453 start_codon:yes stop_codon:yes gene_type:complete
MPSEIILIAAITIDGFIARRNDEITNWTEDLPLFKKQTMGYPVIMGSNTYKTLSSELEGRNVVVVGRNDNPRTIIREINSDRCFIAGGGKTYSRFYPFLTHLYITPHPLIFGSGVSLFSDTVNEKNLSFEKLLEVSRKKGIYQYQYKVRD